MKLCDMAEQNGKESILLGLLGFYAVLLSKWFLLLLLYLVTQHNIMEDVNLQQHCCENLKSHIVE